MHSTPKDTGISDEAIEWYSKINSGHATHDDYRSFESWRKQSALHEQAYADIEKLLIRLDEPARLVFEQHQETQTDRTTLVGPFYGKYRRYSRAAAGISLAMAVAIMLWLPGMLPFLNADYTTRWGERKDIALDDGTMMTLNTHSAVSVDFSPKVRKVSLVSGEIYFQVARNPERPFIVQTKHGNVKVTGTAFNVYQQEDRMTVTVSEGRVRVYTKGGEGEFVDLTPGMQTTGDRRGIGPAVTTDADRAAAWRDGLLIFTMQPLSAVIDELNRYRPGRITIIDPRIRNKIVSGSFDLTHPEHILPAIEKTLGLNSAGISGYLTLLY